ncbi:MAG: NAD(P)H-hydrate dehydratase [Candidatus Omnitrophica bacterium]|nr:NAD(P)H-hydrate dehydratase [Candidatus Omnitrophota bacterium]
MILAGSPRFSGAAVLCAQACLRSGAGLVTLGIPESLNKVFIKIKPTEAMTLPLPQTKEGTLSSLALGKIREFAKKIDVLAIGPGLSRNASTQNLVIKVIKSIDKPLVVDADGLNALAAHLSILSGKTRVILTPHPGEMARLLGGRVSQVQKDRKKVAKDFVNRYNVILVLKGHETLVVEKIKGIYLNKTGNPGMAKAGSGDVLTGIIAAFLAQGLSGFEAAKYAVYLHGLAGDLAAKEKSQLAMIASDIIAKIPKAIKSCSG